MAGKFAFQARLTPYVTLEAGDSYDQVFHNRFHAELTLSIPFGPRSKSDPCKPCSCKSQNMLQTWVHEAPNRAEIIVIDTQKKTSLGLDPVTGEPYFLIFVNNTSSSNGTFESPYNTLANAQNAATPRNVVYVYPGDGTTTGMNAGIDLSLPNTDHVRILGSGVSHPFITTVGLVEIPAQTATMPTITNAGPIVTLGLNNEVSGFQLLNGSPAILGIWGSGTVSANINNNFLNAPAGIGIDLQPSNCTANIIIEGNRILSPTSTGINSPYVNANGVITIQDNTIDSSNRAAFVARGIQMMHTGATNVVVEVFNNTFIDTELDSVYINAQGPGSTIVHSHIEANTFYGRILTGGVGPGIALLNLQTENDSTHISNIQKNRVFGQPVVNQYPSFLVQTAANSTAQSLTQTVFNQNQFSGGADGIIISTVTLGSGSIQTQITENKLRFCSQSGAYAAGAISLNADGGSVTGEVSTNLIHQNGTQTNGGVGIGIHLGAVPRMDLDILRNTITENFTYGISIECGGDALFNVVGNEIAGNARNGAAGGPVAGFHIASNVSGFGRIHVIDNNFHDNLGGDLSALAGSATSTVCARLQGNTADIGYTFDTVTGGGTILLEPMINNTGGFFVHDSITYVPAGACD